MWFAKNSCCPLCRYDVGLLKEEMEEGKVCKEVDDAGNEAMAADREEP